MEINFTAFDHIKRHMGEPPKLSAVNPEQARASTAQAQFLMQFAPQGQLRPFTKPDRSAGKPPACRVSLAHQEHASAGIEDHARHPERDGP